MLLACRALKKWGLRSEHLQETVVLRFEPGWSMPEPKLLVPHGVRADPVLCCGCRAVTEADGKHSDGVKEQ